MSDKELVIYIFSIMDRRDNVKIFRHTVDYCKKTSFPVFVPFKHRFDDPEFSDAKILGAIVPNQPAEIIVANMDSFDMARQMENGTGKILVLNLASHARSGGGVETGAQAQEEDLYRKSNYFEANRHSFYPLKMAEVVYSPLVHIIKDGSYQILPEAYAVSCLAVAAIRTPRLKFLPDKSETYLNEIDAQIMQNKIDMIFKVAIKHGHKQLVLGALGCGVFHNPVREVAIMFKKSIAKYSQYFTRIGFAVLSGPKNSNFEIFSSVILN